MQTDTTTTTTNAAITNTASNPGTMSFDGGDVDEFSSCVVGVDACACISWSVVGVSVSVGVVVETGTGVDDASVRTGVTMFTVVVSTCDSPSSASTVYSPVKASEVLTACSIYLRFFPWHVPKPYPAAESSIHARDRSGWTIEMNFVRKHSLENLETLKIELEKGMIETV